MATRYPPLLVAVGLLCHAAALAVYSPLKDVEVAVPAGWPHSQALLVVRTLPVQAATLSLDAADWAGLDNRTGELRLLHRPGHQVIFRVKAGPAEPLMSVRITPTEATQCGQISAQDLCFWRAATFQVYENQRATVLGRLGPPFVPRMCPHYSLRYNLTNGTEYFSLASDGASLQSREQLDRDTAADGTGSQGPGSKLSVHTTCLLSRGGSGVSKAEATVTVHVLDQDDNPPVAQQLRLLLNSTRLSEGEFLLFTDQDSVAVNSYSYELLSDSATQQVQHDCSLLSDDRGEQSTVIRCKLQSNQTAGAPFDFVLRVNDTSLLPARAPSHADVEVGVGQMASLSQTAAWTPSTAARYDGHVVLFRGASLYARVAQPDALRDLVQAKSAPLFRLDTPSLAFSITPSGGIVYVSDVFALHHAPGTLNLTIEVRFPYNDTVKVPLRVEVVNQTSGGACSTVHFWHNVTEQQWDLCAERDRRKTCEELCGVATGRAASFKAPRSLSAGCVWRPGRGLKKHLFTQEYSTCSPDIETCPDSLCDPLEQTHSHICPQDCTDFVVGVPGWSGPRGIGKVHKDAVCTCDSTNKCSCAVHQKAGNKTRAATPAPIFTQPPRDPNVSTERATNEGACGPECMVGVVVASFILLSTVVGSFICWKYRTGGKGRRDRKFVGSTASLSGIHSDYVDRTLQAMADTPVLPLPSPDPRTMPDPKWEFPRSRLIIEQTLGEGEFGRVLRARALDIGGISGCTTVAVKTLKEGACAAELGDLLSEYQLLKEVAHPNVIRLLGACTTPGAPLYLIIEFAEHGSLRNYLRKSRHLESDGQMPCSFSTTPTATPARAATPASPRDILSFAWQISKGMAYLSDIKLVHRDLAARNVLVAAGKVCKISDFGLTRDVYEDDAYLKRSKGRVPVKWMALESLADHMYTSKSDVWSFGVLMWELVTLGASPYPGVAVHNLFHLLKAGYRMEKPENCSIQLYRVMRSCWDEDPSERPSFKELTVNFEQMLEDGVEYLDLNPRIVHNRTYFTNPRDIINSAEEDLHPAQEDEQHLLRHSYQNEAGHAYLTPIRQRPQSYLNMEGGTSPPQQDLLLFAAAGSSPKTSGMTPL
ncbi:proto-oncogene tyrosine-protein kinase receptor Ret isoform X2 [Periplaneta americana]|uniref:proto-oncogene tyrosine-protein kinase receptor Ret isoform X2 n=1 Tax=Periplaneta americana TaxID=6978 RepID=UPI0037E85CF4